MFRLYDTLGRVATRTQRDAPMPDDCHGGVPVDPLLFTIIAGVLLGLVCISSAAGARGSRPRTLFAPDADDELNAVSQLPPADPGNTLMPFLDPAFAVASAATI